MLGPTPLTFFAAFVSGLVTGILGFIVSLLHLEIRFVDYMLSTILILPALWMSLKYVIGPGNAPAPFKSSIGNFAYVLAGLRRAVFWALGAATTAIPFLWLSGYWD